MKSRFIANDWGTINVGDFVRSYDYNISPLDNKDEITMAAIVRIPILKFDLSNLLNKKINHASLYIKVNSNDAPKEVEITSISQDWDGQYATIVYANEEEKYVHERLFTDIIMGNGNSFHFNALVDFDNDTKIAKIDIPSKLIYAMINDKSFGFGMIDNKSKAYTDTKDFLFKCFNVDEKKGFVPQLEIDYEDIVYKKPEKVTFFEAKGLENDDSYEYASMELRWSVNKNAISEYSFFNLYISEKKTTKEKMSKVPLVEIPKLKTDNSKITTEISHLKPNLEYQFAITVSNNGRESEPVYTSATTSSVVERPIIEKIELDNKLTGCTIALAKNYAVYVLDEISKSNPVNGNIHEIDSMAYTSDNARNLKEYKCHYLNEDKVRLAATLGEKLGFQLLVENKSNEAKKFKLKTNNVEDLKVSLNRVWYIESQNAWYPEVAIPMEHMCEFAIPSLDNKILDQKFQAIFIDVEIPENICHGVHLFNVQFSDGEEIISVTVEIKVENVRLNKADFNFELNGYNPVYKFMGLSYGDKDYDLVEENYYKTAFMHDCNINVLPYSQYGKVHEGCAPKIEFINGTPRVSDWSKWDAHFEKFLDGSYLLDILGRKEPIKQLYMPFHENWPMPIDKYFNVKIESKEYPQMINEYKLKSNGIENDFLPEYRLGIKSIIKDFIRHFDEKGYQDVTFQFYTNNKHYRKQKDYLKSKPQIGNPAEALKNDGKGTSWWLLEEQVFSSDFKATAFFAQILKDAQKEMDSGYNIKFRSDISRYLHTFDYLDGVLDIAALNLNSFTHKVNQAKERKRKFGEEFWVYGGLNNVHESNISPCIWIFNTYLNGVKRILPWNNFGNDMNYEVPKNIAGLYPGNRFGLKGPTVSLRIKAVRRGMELLNYLQTLKNVYGFNELQLKTYVESFIDLKAENKLEYDEDAGYAKYSNKTDETLEKLKRHILHIVTNK